MTSANRKRLSGIQILGLALLLFGTLTGCVKYHPAPLSPPSLERAYRVRNLDDPGFRAYIEHAGQSGHETWPPATFDLNSLTLAAWYFNPELEVARAAVRRSQAAIQAAGEKVNPSLQLSGGRNTGPESPVLFDSLLSFTIETGGKRARRILAARKEEELARAQFLETAWRVRAGVREALIQRLAAKERLTLLRREADLLGEIAGMLERRLESGEISRPEVDTVRQQLAAARASLRDGEGQAAQALAGLAASMGLPAQALNGRPLREQSLEELPGIGKLPLREVQRAGLLHRADIRRALAEYAVAEAAVRLEVARQYPDVQLGPGFIFEEGFARYVIGFSSDLPFFNRHRGAIAVAEAERVQSQKNFELAQARAIGEMEKATAAYRSARAEFLESGARLKSAQRNAEAAARRLATGEGDRLSLAWERLLTEQASQARLTALEKAQVALGALENAMQQPLSGGEPMPEPPLTEPRIPGQEVKP